MTNEAPVAAKPSATILLLRDGEHGLEIFMVKRHHEIDFAAGALVFPGGKVAPGDYEPGVRAHCTGIEGLADAQVALRVAAVREAFEECGLLLARRRGESALLDGDAVAELGPRYRETLDRGGAGIGEMLAREGLVLACEELVPFAHWITPVAQPKRFDTYFFAARAPDRQLAVHDGFEMVDSLWLKPAVAIQEADAGQRVVMPPTRLNLERLGEGARVDEILAAARQRPVVTVLPEPVRGADGKLRMRIPAQAGYSVTEFAPFPRAPKPSS